MEKSKLKNFDTIHFPRNIRLDSLTQGDKIEYIYAARRIISGHKSFLEVDFFSLKEKKIAFRIFMSKQDFITQMRVTEQKWITSKLDNLVSCVKSDSNLIAANERSKKIVSSFLRPQIKDNVSLKIEATPLQMIRFFQSKVRNCQLKKKHQKIKDRIDSEFVCVDKIPKDINDWIEKYPLWDKQYVFYKRKGKKFTGYCSVCRTTVFPEYAKHKLEGICPSCGCPITFKAEGRSKNTRDTFIFNYLQKGINDCIIQRVFEGHKSYRDGFDKPDVSFYERRRYVYRDGKYMPYYHGNFKNTGEYRWCGGFPHKQMGVYVFSDMGSLYAANLKNALHGTKWQDCRIEKFAETKEPFDPADYIALFQKQPEIRYLVDNGLFSLVLEVINDRGYGAQCEIKQQIFDILLDNKSFFPLFKEIGISANELALVNSFPSKKFIKKDILLQIRKTKTTNDFAAIFRYTTPVKALNYIIKQNDGIRSYKDDFIFWLDYLRLAEFLDYDMNSSFILFPKKLQKEHDRVNDEYGKVAGNNGDEKIALMAEKVNSIYGYENKRFIIRAPKHGKELKDEGAALRHCVGSYVNDITALKTFVLLIRDKKAINKPFYTVEFKGNKVRQCHGHLHATATPEINAFLDEWQKQLYKKEQKTLAATA